MLVLGRVGALLVMEVSLRVAAASVVVKKGRIGGVINESVITVSNQTWIWILLPMNSTRHFRLWRVNYRGGLPRECLSWVASGEDRTEIHLTECHGRQVYPHILCLLIELKFKATSRLGHWVVVVVLLSPKPKTL
jgi:hypothetical protein